MELDPELLAWIADPANRDEVIERYWLPPEAILEAAGLTAYDQWGDWIRRWIPDDQPEMSAEKKDAIQ